VCYTQTSRFTAVKNRAIWDYHFRRRRYHRDRKKEKKLKKQDRKKMKKI